MEITEPDRKPNKVRKSRGHIQQEEVMGRLLFVGFWAYLLLVAIFAFSILR